MKKYILVFLSTFIFILVPNVVNAETSSARIYYDENNVTSNSKLVDTNHYFASMGSGTLKSNLTIYLSDKDYQLSGIQNTSLPLVRQIIASNGSEEFVCDIGTSSISYTFATDQSETNIAQLYYLVVNYSYSCDMEMTDYGLADITVYYLPQSSSQPITTVSFGPVFSFTQNETSSLVNSQNNTTNAVNDVNDSINNDTVSTNTENSSTAESWASQSASDSVVSDMVLMPITLLNAFSSGFSGSCQAYNLGSLYGTDLTLPCINIQNYLGSTLWGIIDVLMSGFLIYGIGKKFVKVFNDFTNLKDSQVDELYGGGSE